MSAYAGDFARLYDLFHSEKPYEAEADFVDRLIKREARGASATLLDVACGTGRHAARLATLGWSVVGVDISDDMLEAAAGRTNGLGVTLVRQDMAQLDLEKRDFDAAVCLFDSIGYAVTNEAIAASLTAIRRHLRADALLILEFWHAPAMTSGYDPVRVREWDIPDGRIVRVARTTLDVTAQTATVDYTVIRLNADGRFEEWRETHTNRYFMVQEMRVLLADAGFTATGFFAGFDERLPIGPSTFHVLVVARATGAIAG